jgi:hypothetical protein
MIRSICRRLWLWCIPLAFVLPGCASRDRLPPPAPPAKEVLVPVPVACQIEQVPQAQQPQAQRGAGIFDLTKVIAAQRRILMAENERLRAANNNPCPAPETK